MSVFDHWNPGFDYTPGLEDGPEEPSERYREDEARQIIDSRLEQEINHEA